MVERGVLGNPWLIKQMAIYLKKSKLIEELTIKERIHGCIEYLKGLRELKIKKWFFLKLNYMRLVWLREYLFQLR